MRQMLFIGLAIGCVVAAILYFAWRVLESFYSVYRDWRLGKELDQIGAESVERRKQRELAGQQRLDTGCEHDFSGGYGEFPRNTCPKCGMEKEKPAGSCDHLWKRGDGPIPHSICQKCGKRYDGTAAGRSSGGR